MRLALCNGPNRVGASFILPVDGNISSFYNNVFFRTSRQWTKSRNLVTEALICYNCSEFCRFHRHLCLTYFIQQESDACCSEHV
jgi:hypothetical protein